MRQSENNLSISLIIPSGREKPFILNSLIKLKIVEDLEILFVTDKKNNFNQLDIKKNNIRYLVTSYRNTSLKRNLGGSLASGEILCFTDDDCTINSEWIEEIRNFFKKNKDKNIVFGKTLPYLKTKIKNTQCVGTFEKISQTSTPFKDFPHHSDSVGISNNFAIRKDFFESLHGFKSWLGPGSIGRSGEDADLIVRTLLSQEKIGYNPNMVVYHNHWLDEFEFKKQNASYICGGIATYGYHSLKGVKGCRKIAAFYFWEGVKDIEEFIRLSLKNPLSIPRNVCGILNTVILLIRGIIIAVVFSIID